MRPLSRTVLSLSFALLGALSPASQSHAQGATEQFIGYYNGPAEGEHFDLVGKQITFTPMTRFDGSVWYLSCISSASELPVDHTSHSYIDYNNRFFVEKELANGKTLSFFGIEYDRVFLNEHANMSFGDGDDFAGGTPALALEQHFDKPRISAHLLDYRPNWYASGSTRYAQLDDRIVYTFPHIRVNNNGQNYGTFQTEVFFDGTIRITWTEVDWDSAGVVGLSAGNGIPEGFIETNFSAAPSYPECLVFCE